MGFTAQSRDVYGSILAASVEEWKYNPRNCRSFAYSDFIICSIFGAE
jgi:hypothetical protein